MTSSLAFSQGILRGKITDESGEALIGVTVYLKSNKTAGTFTDLEGNYSLKIASSEPQVVLVSYISYKTIEDSLKALKNNEIVIKNFVLRSAELVQQEVVIEAKKEKSKEYYMESIKRNSGVTIDYISAETMKKTGDPNVTAAVSRVSGVSTNGGLITVRGMGDRYVKTTFNGSRIPTLDPLTNNIKLDMFPASLVDNIIITKTASPDLPGDWAGAYLSVETKDYPEKLLVNIETQVGYNAQTSFKEVISSARSATEWLGYDDGLRERKQKHDVLYKPNTTVTPYQEMVALGLESYYKSLGVTDWGAGGTSTDTYYKLGLVQLGLLAPGLINDNAAFAAANNLYNASYKTKANNIINPEGTDYNNGFANNYNAIKRKAPLNFTQSFSVGNQTTLFGKQLGYIFGFRYGNSTRYDGHGVSRRLQDGSTPENLLMTKNDTVEISRETNGWSALLNVAYKWNNNHTTSVLFMPNLTGTNDVAGFTSVQRDPTTHDLNIDDIIISKNQFYEQRKQLIYQVKSEHYLPKSKMKIDLNVSYTDGKSTAPDFKTTSYVYNGSTNSYIFSPTADQGITRYYRYLTENVLDSRISAELPIGSSAKAGVRKIKFGAAYQENGRKSDTYGYAISGWNTKSVLMNDDLNDYLDPSKFIINNGTSEFYYTKSFGDDETHNNGMSTIKSGFILADYSIIPSLRASGGLRVEQANIFTDIFKYYNLGYTKNELRSGSKYSGSFNELSYLPSVNIIYKLLDKPDAQINVRLNYSQTVARPSIRELTASSVFDKEYRTRFDGNPNLKMAQSQNYDVRVESYFKHGDNVSVSLFYKKIKNNIELAFGDGGITWVNTDTSNVKGIELEGKKSITKWLELKANVTYVYSKTVYNNSFGDRISRTMLGQAPYVINGMLVYKADSIGLTATLSYNIQGPRLVIAGYNPTVPNVYEMQRHVLDFKISKTVGKHFSVNFTMRDLLNAPVRRAYKLGDQSLNVNYDYFRYGTNYILGIIYKI